MIQQLDPLNPDTAREVRQYLHHAPASAGACGEHDPAWLEVLRLGLGHRPIALISRDTPGAINGYLPLAVVKSALFGRFLVSLPYLNRAGVVAGDPAVAGELIAAAVDMAAKVNAQYLELRHCEPFTHASFNAQRDEKVRMVLTLPAGAEPLWKSFDPKVRNLIRKGDKSGLGVKWGGLELLDGFYDVFAVNMRDLGTPVYGKKLFAQIITQLQGRAEFCVVEMNHQPLAGALLIHDPAMGEHPASTAVPSASALRRFNSTNANMWMYHQLLLRAMERGSAEFDFGRSSQDSGTYKFKKQWGALPRQTVWQYHVRHGDIAAARPDNPKYQRRIEMWKKLPVWLTRLVGPPIVRGVP